MLKSVTCLAIFLLFLTSFSTPASAQVQHPAQNANASNANTTKVRPNLKSLIAENERRYNANSGNVTVKELEKIDREQQQQKKGWTGKQKLALVAVIVGIAALVFVLVKYGKDCIRSEPSGCNPVTDDNCRCLEYEQNR